MQKVDSIGPLHSSTLRLIAVLNFMYVLRLSANKLVNRLVQEVVENKLRNRQLTTRNARPRPFANSSRSQGHLCRTGSFPACDLGCFILRCGDFQELLASLLRWGFQSRCDGYEPWLTPCKPPKSVLCAWQVWLTGAFSNFLAFPCFFDRYS